MSETPSQPPPLPGHEPGSGWNTEHLKDYRRMRRSIADRKVAGVAGGLGRHLDVDPTILRVLFVVLTFFGGAGLVLYGVLWAVVPEEHTEKAVVGTSEATRNTVLIAAAAVAVLLAIGDSWNGVGFPWGLLVAGVVVFLVLANRDQGATRGGPPPGTPGYPVDGRFPAGDAGSSAPGAPPAHGAHSAHSAHPAAPAAPAAGSPLGYNPAVPPGYAYPPGTTPGWAPPTPPPPPPTRRRKTGPLLFGPTLALLALALGALGLYDAYVGSVVDAAYPALAVTIIGAALVVGAFYGRAGGLPLLGLVAALALPVTAIGGPSFDGDRDIRHRPVTAAALEESISVPAGRILVDLTAVEDLDEVDGRRLELDANAGEIEVVVPEGLRLDYRADIEFGGLVETPNGDDDGWGASEQGVVNEDAPARMFLDADLRFGHIEVRSE